MTQQRDLKRRIRERMARTGETYITARRHVLAARDDEPAPAPAFDVVETLDISEHAIALDLECRAAMFPRLAARVDATTALTRLRDALVRTDGDRALDLMRRLVLHGELPPPLRDELRRSADLVGFIRRVRAGIGGASPGGRMVALAVDDVMMLCVAASTRHREPIVYLQASDEIIGQRNIVGFAL